MGSYLKPAFALLALTGLGHLSGCHGDKIQPITPREQVTTPPDPEGRPAEPEPETAPAADKVADAVIAPVRTAQELEVEVDEAYQAADGLTVLVRSDGHAHSFGGGTTSDWALLVTRGEERFEVDYQYSDSDLYWYFEGIALGYLFTVSSLFDPNDRRTALTAPEDLAKNSRRRITLTPTDRRALTKNETSDLGLELTRHVLDDEDCAGTLSSGSSAGPGVFQLGRFSDDGHNCRVLVGVYTRQTLAFRKWTDEEDEAEERERQAEIAKRKPFVRLTRAQMQEVLKSAAGKVKDCCEGARGVISIRLTVAPNGRVVEAHAKEPWADTPQGSCAEKAVTKLRFPKFDGDDVVVTFPYRL